LDQIVRDFLFHLSPKSGGGLQSQIRHLVVDAILEGQLPAGSPLPSCRKLARDLGVARNTVVLAY
jgi:GntR family transcriptional regulator/MocR family aminotransferase